MCPRKKQQGTQLFEIFTYTVVSIIEHTLLHPTSIIVTLSCFYGYRVGTKTQPESKCPELLANYCDMLLRKTPLSKKLTSEEVEKKLRDVVSSTETRKLAVEKLTTEQNN